MKRLLLASGVAAALALSACGSSTPAARKAALKTYVQSLGASPNLQVTMSATVSGAKSAQAGKVLNELSLGFNFSNPSGQALSKSNGTANTEITASVHGSTFAWVRSVDSSIYLKVDFTAFSNIPGANFSQSEAAAAQTFFGNTWWELPQSVLNSVVPKKHSTAANTSTDRAAATKVIDALTNLIDTTPYKDHGNGTFSETGTILSAARALAPVLSGVTNVPTPTAKSAKGTYTLTVSTSGSTATGMSLNVTSPNSSGGSTSATVKLTFAHADSPVTKPSNPKVLSKSVLQELGVGAG